MTLLEAENIAVKLTDLNIKYWEAKTAMEKSKAKNDFTTVYNSITSNGFRILRARIYDHSRNMRIPIFKVKKQKNIGYMAFEDNRAKNININNDCTTRCISYCTGVDYMKIRNEQLTNAAYCGASWNTNWIWAKSLESRGFKQLILPKKMSRATFLKKFSNKIKAGIFATHSSGHIAAIDMARQKIIDTWNSSGGRIDYMYVHESQYENVKNIINDSLKVSRKFKI